MPSNTDNPKTLEGEELTHTIELKNNDTILLRLERQYPLSEADYLKIVLSRNLFYYFAGAIILSFFPVGLEILTKFPDIEKWMIKYLFWGAILTLALLMLGLLSPKRKKRVTKKIEKYFDDSEKKE